VSADVSAERMAKVDLAGDRVAEVTIAAGVAVAKAERRVDTVAVKIALPPFTKAPCPRSFYNST